MNEEINTYDEVFEDLYEKYKESANMAPELKLVFMVASSAFWFHISNNMSKSVMGNMNMGDMFKNKECFIDSLIYTIDDNNVWETGEYAPDYKLPRIIDVGITLKFVESKFSTFE